MFAKIGFHKKGGHKLKGENAKRQQSDMLWYSERGEVRYPQRGETTDEWELSVPAQKFQQGLIISNNRFKETAKDKRQVRSNDKVKVAWNKAAAQSTKNNEETWKAEILKDDFYPSRIQNSKQIHSGKHPIKASELRKESVENQSGDRKNKARNQKAKSLFFTKGGRTIVNDITNDEYNNSNITDTMTFVGTFDDLSAIINENSRREETLKEAAQNSREIDIRQNLIKASDLRKASVENKSGDRNKPAGQQPKNLFFMKGGRTNANDTSKDENRNSNHIDTMNYLGTFDDLTVSTSLLIKAEQDFIKQVKKENSTLISIERKKINQAVLQGFAFMTSSEKGSDWKAVEWFQEAQDLIHRQSRINGTEKEVMVLTKLAVIFDRNDQGSKAVDMTTKAFLIYVKSPQRESFIQLVGTYLFLGNQRLCFGDTKGAEVFYSKALETIKVTSGFYEISTELIIEALRMRGRLKAAEKRYKSSIEQISEALVHIRRLYGKDVKIYADTMRELGCVLLLDGKENEAFEAFYVSSRIYEDLGIFKQSETMLAGTFDSYRNLSINETTSCESNQSVLTLRSFLMHTTEEWKNLFLKNVIGDCSNGLACRDDIETIDTDRSLR